MKIEGDRLREFSIVAACDPLYMREHAPALASSCKKVNNRFHLHVISPSKDDENFARELKEKMDGLMTVTVERSRITANPRSQRTSYAINRFYLADTLLKEGISDFLVVDVDCYLMKHIEPPDADAALFLREPIPGTVGWEKEGTCVAAGAVYYKNPEFAQLVADKISAIRDEKGLMWFLDQKALNEAYLELKDKLKFHIFDSSFMDWEFIEGTTIWTGKGPRKTDNPIYVAKKKEFEASL